jgi:hypothetical protein
VAWGIQSGGVSSSIGFNLSLYLESRATPGISASKYFSRAFNFKQLTRNQNSEIFSRREVFSGLNVCEENSL